MAIKEITFFEKAEERRNAANELELVVVLKKETGQTIDGVFQSVVHDATEEEKAAFYAAPVVEEVAPIEEVVVEEEVALVSEEEPTEALVVEEEV